MNSRHARPAAQALYQVFVAPALSKPSPQRVVSWSVASIHRHAQLRSFSQTIQHNAKTRAPEKRTQKWDSEIKSFLIYLVNPETNQLRDPEDQSLPEPQRLKDVIASFNPETHRLIQLEASVEDIPVCKIIDKKADFEAAKRRLKAQKESKKASARTSEAGMKTVELNWAIDRNDLGHRLDKVRQFLREGRKVEVVLASKKRGRKATMEECEGVVSRIQQVVADVQGAKELEEARQGKIGAFATLVLQGPRISKQREGE